MISVLLGSRETIRAGVCMEVRWKSGSCFDRLSMNGQLESSTKTETVRPERVEGGTQYFFVAENHISNRGRSWSGSILSPQVEEHAVQRYSNLLPSGRINNSFLRTGIA